MIAGNIPFPLFEGTALRSGGWGKEYFMPWPAWRANKCLPGLVAGGAEGTAQDTITGMNATTILIVSAMGGLRTDMQLALDAGASPNAVDDCGRPVLHLASLAMSIPCVQFLLERGADVDAESREGETALQATVRTARHTVSRVLIGAGADGSRAWSDGTTMLHRVAEQGVGLLVVPLVGAGADVRARNPAGQTPLMLATACGHVNTARLLLAMGADMEEINEVPAGAMSAEMKDFLAAWKARASTIDA